MSCTIVNAYLVKQFPSMELEPPLFYNSPFGIRFELGIPYRGIEEPNYFSDLIKRALQLFETIFNENDDLYVVVKSYRSIEPYTNFNQGDDVFPKYLNNEDLSSQVDTLELKKQYKENGDLSGIRYQYSLVCRKEEIDYQGIVTGKAHADHAIEPYIWDAVYFINPSTHVVFYMYDDRGLDIISNNRDSLIWLNRRFNDWILDYDRESIDRVFK